MARAQFIAETKPKPHRQRFVHLKLTEGEADLILAMCAAVGGSRKRSPRKYADRIRDSLSRTMNLSFVDTDAAELMSGGIWFSNYGDTPCPADELGLNEAVMVTRDRLAVLAMQPEQKFEEQPHHEASYFYGW